MGRWWGRKRLWPLWRPRWRFLESLKPQLLNNPAIPLLGLQPKPTNHYLKDTCTQMFSTAKVWKHTVSPAGRVDTANMVHLHAQQTVLHHEMKETPPFATTRMSPDGIRLGRMSPRETNPG